jgi:hypothetical protein
MKLCEDISRHKIKNASANNSTYFYFILKRSFYIMTIDNHWKFPGSERLSCSFHILKSSRVLFREQFGENRQSYRAKSWEGYEVI